MIKVHGGKLLISKHIMWEGKKELFLSGCRMKRHYVTTIRLVDGNKFTRVQYFLSCSRFPMTLRLLLAIPGGFV